MTCTRGCVARIIIICNVWAVWLHAHWRQSMAAINGWIAQQNYTFAGAISVAVLTIILWIKLSTHLYDRQYIIIYIGIYTELKLR